MNNKKQHGLLERLNDNLKGYEFQTCGPVGVFHSIHPCNGCGKIMYRLYSEDKLILDIEFDSVEAVNIACQMYNRISDKPAVSSSNFVDFLIHLHEAYKLQSSN